MCRAGGVFCEERKEAGDGNEVSGGGALLLVARATGLILAGDVGCFGSLHKRIEAWESERLMRRGHDVAPANDTTCCHKVR
jgi:hypothetical protein